MGLDSIEREKFTRQRSHLGPVPSFGAPPLLYLYLFFPPQKIQKKK